MHVQDNTLMSVTSVIRVDAVMSFEDGQTR